MSRVIIIAVLVGIIVASLEGVAESAVPGLVDADEHGHEAHGPLHFADHEHSDQDDHFCHCGVHTAALISMDVAVIIPGSPQTARRFNESFTSRHSPPLLRPPNA